LRALADELHHYYRGKTMATTANTMTMNAIAMLEADHRKVQKAFKDFEKLKEGGGKREKSAIARG
jgi:hypothetical protein